MDNSSYSPSSNIPISNKRLSNLSNGFNKRFTNLNNSYTSNATNHFVNEQFESSFGYWSKLFMLLKSYCPKNLSKSAFYLFIAGLIISYCLVKVTSAPNSVDLDGQNKIVINFRIELNNLKNTVHKLSSKRIEPANKENLLELSALKQTCKTIVEEKLDQILLNKLMPLKREIDSIKITVNEEMDNLKTNIELFLQEQKELGLNSMQIDRTALNNSIKLQIQSLILDNNLDKYTKPDYASELNKASVLDASTTYTEPNAIKFFSIPIWSLSSPPSELLKRNIFLFNESPKPWKMNGEQGFIKIKLAKPIIPVSFVYEHVLRNHILDENQLSCSPKLFQVVGYTDEDESTNLGEFIFNINKSTETEYMFKRIKNPISIIQFNIESNHGNSNFTCLHRIRVF